VEGQEPVDLREVTVRAQYGRAMLHAYRGDPDVVDRYRLSLASKLLLDLREPFRGRLGDGHRYRSRLSAESLELATLLRFLRSTREAVEELADHHGAQ